MASAGTSPTNARLSTTWPTGVPAGSVETSERPSIQPSSVRSAARTSASMGRPNAARVRAWTAGTSASVSTRVSQEEAGEDMVKPLG